MKNGRMGRRRLLLALAVAAFALGAAPPKNAVQRNASAAARQPFATQQPQNTRQHEACRKGTENRGSDLCAQWKAADAAHSASQAAWWMGAVGAVIGLLTLAVAVAAALYARTAANAAKDTLHHELHRSRAELRPWVKIEATVTKFVADDAGFQIAYEAVFRNIGQTVAESVTFETNSAFTTLDVERVKSEYSAREPKEETFALMPGEDRRGGGFHTTMRRSLPWHTTKKRRSVSFVITATVFYRSGLDEKWHRTDRSFLIGWKDDSFNDGYFLYDDLRGEGRDLVTIRAFVAGETS